MKRRLAKRCPLCLQPLVTRYRRVDKAPKGSYAWHGLLAAIARPRTRVARVTTWWTRRVCLRCDVIVVLQPMKPHLRNALRAKRPSAS